ncbi:MAG: MqnA/MqnD/SBP family protein [Phycisphaerales bacterium]
MHTLTLAHSGDPDDAFMWWPLTGKVWPDGSPRNERGSEPRIEHADFSFKAVPGDIAQFNRLATKPESEGGCIYDITALSVRAWADAHDKYILTNCGSSFGDGYGPKVVCNATSQLKHADDLKQSTLRIAVPGKKTSAFMTMCLMLGLNAEQAQHARFVEVPFDHILPAVVKGEVDAGLVIHEAQVTFEAAGLRKVVDLGVWWKKTRGLPLPLGVNAIKRDLDTRFTRGTVQEVATLLERSLDYAMQHREESIDYTMAFAELNAKTSGTQPPDRDTVERYIDMYVTSLTVDMGQEGRTAIAWLLEEGAKAGLCPSVAEVEVV